MARKTKEEAGKTRMKILETSLEVFYEQGYSGATFVKIANRIDLTTGAVYWHFKTKTDLFLGLGAFMFDRLNTAMHSVFTKAKTFDELTITARNVVQLIIKDPQLKKYFALILFRMEWKEALLPVRDMFAAQDLEYKKYTQHVFEQQQKNGNISQELSTEVITDLWLGFINGFLSRHLNGNEKIEGILKEFTLGADIFINGVTTWPSNSREKLKQLRS